MVLRGVQHPCYMIFWSDDKDPHSAILILKNLWVGFVTLTPNPQNKKTRVLNWSQKNWCFFADLLVGGGFSSIQRLEFWSNYSDLKRLKTTQMVVKSKGNSLISGKSGRLVKYDSIWPDSCAFSLWFCFELIWFAIKGPIVSPVRAKMPTKKTGRDVGSWACNKHVTKLPICFC